MQEIINLRGTRRALLIGGGTLVAAAVLGPGALWAAAPKEVPGADVTPTEDLMREHGVLRRLMLIFDELGKRLEKGAEFPLQTLKDSADLIRRFLQDYHEKDEEMFIFPRFQKAGRLLDLVRVLFEQHEAGRKLISQVQSQATLANLQDPGARTKLAGYLQAFNRMYRPHAAWEDTVLYPVFRGVISPQEFVALGAKFEDKEQELFGKNGFEKIVEQVGSLEKTLGIYELAQFTVKV
jgi:hemerythrin-like domain-containing protein